MQEKHNMLHDEPTVSYYKHDQYLHAAYYHAKKAYKMLKHLVHDNPYHRRRRRKWESSSCERGYESSHWC